MAQLMVERANLRLEGDETKIANDLDTTIVFVSAKADVNQIMSPSIKDSLLYWQAVYLSCFVASRHSGEGVERVVWRISDRILGTSDWCLIPSHNAVTEYFELLPQGESAGNREMAKLRSVLDRQDETAIDRHEIVSWLRQRASRVGQTEIRVAPQINGG